MLLIQMAKTMKICIFDTKLVKPKCVWEANIYFENCKQTAEKSKWMYPSETYIGFTNLREEIPLPTKGLDCKDIPMSLLNRKNLWNHV